MTTPQQQGSSEPTGWEVLRRLDKLEHDLAVQFSDFGKRLDDGDRRFYSRDFLDGQQRATTGRLDALEQTAIEAAANRQRRFSQLLVAGAMQSMATASAVTLIYFQH